MNYLQLERFEIFTCEKYCDLETRVRGIQKSLKMTPFQRSYITSVPCLRLCHAPILAYLISANFYRDLEIQIRVTQGHSNV